MSGILNLAKSVFSLFIRHRPEKLAWAGASAPAEPAKIPGCTRKASRREGNTADIFRFIVLGRRNGYHRLSHLRQYTLNILKVERSWFLGSRKQAPAILLRPLQIPAPRRA